MTSKHTSNAPVVMVIDDDELTCEVAVEFLTNAGFQSVSSPSAAAAIDIIGRVSPDIVLLDVDMPEMDGYAACLAIRSMPRGATVPILMLGDINDASQIDRAFEAGATDFTRKPVNWPLLVHRIRSVLQSNELLHAFDRSRESLDTAQRIAGLGNWDWSRATKQIIWSDNLFRMLGLQPQFCVPDLALYLQYTHEDDRANVQHWLFNDDCRSRCTNVRHGIVTKNGEVRQVLLQIEVIRDDSGVVSRKRGVVQDITEQHEAEKKIHQLAYYDSLTRLPNRALFCERLAAGLAEAKRESWELAVMFLDLDNFKQVNDSLGHAYGDILLQDVSERLQSCADELISGESSDSVRCTVARMGGDEFTVMLTHLNNRQEAVQLASRISNRLSGIYALEGYDCHTSTSTGIAFFPEHGLSVDELLKTADIAMYTAKKQGKSCYRVYDLAMNEDSVRRYQMEELLRKAVELDELVLHYQPQMNLETGHLEAVEALVRWNSAELGFVSPADFIPLAEDTGLIVPIGEWILRTACCQAKEWIDSGVPLMRIAVNISVLEFVRPDFLNVVTQILEESGLSPTSLELEITESVLVKDTSIVVNTLISLRALGIQLSIDDFGTGFSSLSQLKHFPIDRLKIDQSFIRGMITNIYDAAIVKAVLTMASSMNLRVVAEGVETPEQLEYLYDCQCNEVQGYLLSRPVPADKIAEIFHNTNDFLSTRTGTDG